MKPPVDNGKPILCVVFDIDGVLTDGTTPVRGRESKRLHFRDLDAIGALRRAGIEVAFLTGESRDVAQEVVDRCGGGPAVYQAKEKRAGIVAIMDSLEVEPDRVCFVGDSERDVPAMREVALALAPSDASDAARHAADHVLSAKGGSGVAAEVAAIVIEGADSRASVAADAEHARSEARVLKSSLGQFVSQTTEGVAKLAAFLHRRLSRGGAILLFGNGGSAVMSQHAAAELVGRFRRERRPFRAVCLNADSAVLTAVSNDYGYEASFGRQIRALGRTGDVAFAMSTSGTSRNVVEALNLSRELGLHTVLLTGDHDLDDRIADFCINVPSRDTARIQELHLLTWHLICDLLEKRSSSAEVAAGDGSQGRSSLDQAGTE